MLLLRVSRSRVSDGGRTERVRVEDVKDGVKCQQKVSGLTLYNTLSFHVLCSAGYESSKSEKLLSYGQMKIHTHTHTYVMFTPEVLCHSLPLKPVHSICPVTLLSPFFLPLQIPSPFQAKYLTLTQQKEKKNDSSYVTVKSQP